MIKIFYSLFIGILLAIFVGVGISVFYDEPVYPEQPTELKYDEYNLDEKQRQQLWQAYDEEVAAFEKEEIQPYNRNVSIIAIVASVVLLGVGMAVLGKVSVIADGMLLGGVFTLFYGTMRGMATESDVFRFIVISVALAIAIALGYWKFGDKIAEKSEN